MVVAGEYIQEAISAVESERNRLRAERDAFREFAEEVATVDLPARSPNAQTTVVVARATGGQNRCQFVRDRYRETVMAVPHYEEEYAESLRENMAMEFTRDLATAVATGQQFSPQIKQLLVGQARIAARRRDELLATAGRERASLSEVAAILCETEAPFPKEDEETLAANSFSQLASIESELRHDIDRCERSLSERQRDLRAIADQWGHPDHTEFYHYLYGHLDVTYPALNALLDSVRALQKRRQTVVRALMDYQ